MSCGAKHGDVQGLVLLGLLAVMVLTGISLFFGDLTTNYAVDTTGYAPVFQSSQSIYTTAEGMQNVSEGMKENPDVITATQGFTGAISVILLLPSFAVNFLTALITMTGLNVGWVVAIIGAMLITVIAFGFLNWIRGGANRL